MDFPTIAVAIAKGELDTTLDRIKQVIQDRKESIARATFYTLKEGDKVRFVNTVRPRYLAGQTATIREMRQKKVSVRLDSGPQGRFHGDILTAVSLIEKVA